MRSMKNFLRNERCRIGPNRKADASDQETRRRKQLQEKPSGGVGDGLDGSRRGRDGFGAKGGQDAFGGGSGAASPEHGFDGGRSHAAGPLRRRGEDPEVEGPSPVEVRSGLEEGRGSSA